MIQSISINNFKAFREEFFFQINSQSQLIYGDNGAGKSSIYEAFKYYFFKSKLESAIENASTPEEQEQVEADFWSKYANRNSTEPIDIKINTFKSEDFPRNNINVFLMSIENLTTSEVLNFERIVNDLYFDWPTDIGQFCSESHELIEENVNKKIRENFNEEFSIEIDLENDYNIRFLIPDRNISVVLDYHRYINESRINLTIILICLSIAELHNKGNECTNLMIFDDIITSFDITNRSHLLKYILKTFSNTQIILLTHNVHLFNLAMYIINDSRLASDTWKFNNIYEFKDIHKILDVSTPTAESINNNFNLNESNLDAIGNQVRQRFEVLLYEFSKLLLIGSLEESKEILTRIESRKPIYIRNGKGASDLVEEIESQLQYNNSNYLKNRILSKINNYKIVEYYDLIDTMEKLKLYRKVILHPMSHGIIGRPAYTVKELKFSIELLCRLEKLFNRLSNSTVDGM